MATVRSDHLRVHTGRTERASSAVERDLGRDRLSVTARSGWLQTAPLRAEAVAQSRRDRVVRRRAAWGVRTWAWLGGAWVGRCDLAGGLSGSRGGYLVAVELGEVVTHHD